MKLFLDISALMWNHYGFLVLFILSEGAFPPSDEIDSGVDFFVPVAIRCGSVSKSWTILTESHNRVLKLKTSFWKMWTSFFEKKLHRV